jgi:KaiC/GvpD/RAD55 family RecA-like ATPase
MSSDIQCWDDALPEEIYTEKDGLIKRVRTGITGLDSLIEGGLPEKSITLVSGPPGSGKSIFSFQYLYEGLKSREKGLFLTLDKKVNGLLIQAKKLGFNFQSALEDKYVKFRFLNINKKLIYETMLNEILSEEYDRIVLDSITPLSEMPIHVNSTEIKKNIDTSIVNSEEFTINPNLPIRRLHLHYIMNALETSESTSVVTSELQMGSSLFSRDGISEFLADGVITLSFDPTMDRRKLSVMKMRNTKHTLKPQDIEIIKGGIQFI